MVAEEAQVELGERCPAGTWLHVVTQGLHVLVETRLVLGIELEHPGFSSSSSKLSCSAFSKASRAWASQPGSRPSVPSGTSSKKAATDWPSSSNMDLDSGKNSTQGSSSTKDGATSYSACSSASVAGLRPRTAEPGSGMPAWRKASMWRCQPSGCSSSPAPDAASFSAAGLGQGSFQRISSPPALTRHRVLNALVQREDGRVAGHRHRTGSVPARCGYTYITRSGLGRRWNWRWTSLRAVRV